MALTAFDLGMASSHSTDCELNTDFFLTLTIYVVKCRLAGSGVSQTLLLIPTVGAYVPKLKCAVEPALLIVLVNLIPRFDNNTVMFVLNLNPIYGLIINGAGNADPR